MNYVIWDIETDSAQLDWATMIEIGAILLCTKENIFQRFIAEGERLVNYQNQFLEKVEQFYSQRTAN